MKVNNYKNFLLEFKGEDIEFMMNQLNEYFTIGFEIELELNKSIKESLALYPSRKNLKLVELFKKSFPNFSFKYENFISFHEDETVNGIEIVNSNGGEWTDEIKKQKKYPIDTPRPFEKIDTAMVYLKDFFDEFNSQKNWKFSHNTSLHINVGIKLERRRTLTNGLYIPLNIVKGVIMISDQEKKGYTFKGIEERLVNYCSSIKTKLIENLKKEPNYELYSGDINEMERYLHFKIKDLYNFFTPKLFGMIFKNSKYGDYVEFRYVGGENMRFEILKDKLMYFCYIVYLMSSEYRKKEYHKKLFVFREKVK
jgi:hypothetical protein